jgi:glycine cleavage system aminomethyltransferase T
MTEFDMSLIQQGPRLRRSPYFEATQRAGAKAYTVYNHMFIPMRYDSFEAEYEALLNEVTLWDVSVERCLEIAGPDGFEFAQLLTPRDLSQCAVGQAKYVLMCDMNGGIINDPVLTRMEENKFWFALASSDALLFALGVRTAFPHLNVTIREADVAPLQVQGPKSKDFMTRLVGEDILDLKYYWWRHAEIKGIPVIITRTGWTSEVGYEIYLTDTSRGVQLWDHIVEVGEPFNLRPTGPSEIRRIEGGIYNYGVDMNHETNPLEMGLERLVGWDLQDEASISLPALRRIREEGITRRIVGMEFDGEPFSNNYYEQWPVLEDGIQIGKVTSAIYSPRLKKNIGYAMIPLKKGDLGRSFTVESEFGTRRGTVVEKPFVDPEKRIPVS